MRRDRSTLLTSFDSEDNSLLPPTMSDPGVKTLHFYGQNLGQPVNFILVFAPPSPLKPGQWFGNVFPMCWGTNILVSFHML